MYKFENLEKTKCIKCDNFLQNIDIDGSLKTEKGPIFGWTVDTENLGCKQCGLYYLACPGCMNNYNFDYDPNLGPVYLLQFIGLDCLIGNKKQLSYRPNKPKCHPSLRTNSNMCDEYDYDGYSSVMSYLEYGTSQTDTIDFLSREYLEKYSETTLNITTEWACSEMNHWVGDKNLFYLDPEVYISPTGDDGGEFHHWYCTNCNNNFSFTDR